MRSPQFGGKIRPSDLERFSQSSQWDGRRFVNAVETKIDINLRNLPGLIKANIKGRSKRGPSSDIPLHDLGKGFFQDSASPSFAWFGHSALLTRMGAVNILIDPMLGNDASPIGPFRTWRYSKDIGKIIGQLPRIDLVLITHDHYDHLDYGTIQRIKGQVDKWYVALGVGRHLESWGIDPSSITEFDWWDQVRTDGLEITFTPSRHFGGRGAFDRARSLWGGWVIRDDDHSVYWSGDGGYGDHFREIGSRFGPFNVGFMECGQYNERWHAIHMYPEESVLAARDAQVAHAVPVHWGGFTLALHPWTEPVTRFVDKAISSNTSYALPLPGEIFGLDTKRDDAWWMTI